ncbi:MAG TPA: DUF4830 domain-containing protein [Candidatus Faecousia excrementigallinarum]|uniref:DUF4830 domain-containing protein n=1 Tax=Candidatus Faecousia excrementigallinarum TaxID=2840806 RepID=A0A9D0Z1Q2_9FIRM|nr:DUF4830 domain-containing protein [Candidatus Faecousia excrementigallinarum]
MMVMTAKVDKKKILMVLAGVAAAILLLLLVFGGGGETQDPTVQTSTGNDKRVAFLQEFGWEVNASPAQSGEVRIPETPTKAYERYNALQKSQGYDLTKYAGQTVMRYVYKVTNYPGATDPVYATLLVHKDAVIGGDITDTSAKGRIHGFQMPQSVKEPAATESTQPSQGATTGNETAPTTDTDATTPTRQATTAPAA